MHFCKATVSTKIETASRAPNTLWYFLCKIVKQTPLWIRLNKKNKTKKKPFLTFDKSLKFFQHLLPILTDMDKKKEFLKYKKEKNTESTFTLSEALIKRQSTNKWHVQAGGDVSRVQRDIRYWQSCHSRGIWEPLPTLLCDWCPKVLTDHYRFIKTHWMTQQFTLVMLIRVHITFIHKPITG